MTSGERYPTAFPLRLATSLKDTAFHFAASEGISLNTFISLAVAEKISRLESEALKEHGIVKRKQRLTLAAGVLGSSVYIQPFDAKH